MPASVRTEQALLELSILAACAQYAQAPMLGSLPAETKGDKKMSVGSIVENMGTYMNMSALGLYNSMTPLGYLGTSFPTYSLPFSSVLSNVLGTLSANSLNAQNIAGFRTINMDSTLQKELNKLGYGNMMILIPEEYQKQVEENTENSQKINETFKKWKTNYDTANAGRNQRQRGTGSQERAFTASPSHSHSLGTCTFGRRI